MNDKQILHGSNLTCSTFGNNICLYIEVLISVNTIVYHIDGDSDAKDLDLSSW